MTDYSKPIGWWCKHDETGTVHDLVDGPITTVGHGDHSKSCLVPVYPVIPEGERPETTIASFDDLEVCTCIDDDNDTMIASGDAIMSDALGWVIAGYCNRMEHVETSARLNVIARVSAHFASKDES